ncbi:MAG: putative sugar nucleotidyl transferase [Planctomycetota bacterium]|jgi:hypothetical protein
MRVCLFEDTHFENFYPLTLSRPVWELRCGMASLREKLLAKVKAADAGGPTLRRHIRLPSTVRSTTRRP